MTEAGHVAAIYERIGRWVKRRRELHKLTQADLAELIGLSKTAISNIEHGRHRLMVHQLVAIEQLLGEPSRSRPKGLRHG